jgi:hypothetical protein
MLGYQHICAGERLGSPLTPPMHATRTNTLKQAFGNPFLFPEN